MRQFAVVSVTALAIEKKFANRFGLFLRIHHLYYYITSSHLKSAHKSNKYNSININRLISLMQVQQTNQSNSFCFAPSFKSIKEPTLQQSKVSINLQLLGYDEDNQMLPSDNISMPVMWGRLASEKSCFLHVLNQGRVMMDEVPQHKRISKQKHDITIKSQQAARVSRQKNNSGFFTIESDSSSEQSEGKQRKMVAQVKLSKLPQIIAEADFQQEEEEQHDLLKPKQLPILYSKHIRQDAKYRRIINQVNKQYKLIRKVSLSLPTVNKNRNIDAEASMNAQYNSNYDKQSIKQRSQRQAIQLLKCSNAPRPTNKKILQSKIPKKVRLQAMNHRIPISDIGMDLVPISDRKIAQKQIFWNKKTNRSEKLNKSCPITSQ